MLEYQNISSKWSKNRQNTKIFAQNDQKNQKTDQIFIFLVKKIQKTEI